LLFTTFHRQPSVSFKKDSSLKRNIFFSHRPSSSFVFICSAQPSPLDQFAEFYLIYIASNKLLFFFIILTNQFSSKHGVVIKSIAFLSFLSWFSFSINSNNNRFSIGTQLFPIKSSSSESTLLMCDYRFDDN